MFLVDTSCFFEFKLWILYTGKLLPPFFTLPFLPDDLKANSKLGKKEFFITDFLMKLVHVL